jgi:hypothetical protein
VTAGEDQPQSVIFKIAIGDFATDVGVIGDEKSLRSRRDVATTTDVNGPSSRDRREPSAGILGDALLSPGGEGAGECILDAFFGDVEVTRDSNRGGQHERPLVTVGVRDGR